MRLSIHKSSKNIKDRIWSWRTTLQKCCSSDIKNQSIILRSTAAAEKHVRNNKTWTKEGAATINTILVLRAPLWINGWTVLGETVSIGPYEIHTHTRIHLFCPLCLQNGLTLNHTFHRLVRIFVMEDSVYMTLSVMLLFSLEKYDSFGYHANKNMFQIKLEFE